MTVSDSVSVPAHAKINLHLRILDTRPDGYHDVVTVLQTLALHDTVTCAVHDGPFEIQCDVPGVPLGETNLVWRAARQLADLTGRPEGIAGTRVTIDKRIPTQAGLGGGSADAAAALLGLARLWALDIVIDNDSLVIDHDRARPAPALRALAGRLGADVPFLLEGGTMLGVGRGDELSLLPEFPECPVLLVMPPFGVPTADAYRWHDERVAADAELGILQHGRWIGASSAEWPTAPADWDRWLGRCVNDFERAIGPRHPEIQQTAEALRSAGAQFAALTGSGAALFGLFASDAAAAAAQASFTQPGWRTFLTRTARSRA